VFAISLCCGEKPWIDLVHVSEELLGLPVRSDVLVIPSSGPATLFTRMLKATTFSSDKRFGLADIGHRTERKAAVGQRGEALSVIFTVRRTA
jgi:hypothetical protein